MIQFVLQASFATEMPIRVIVEKVFLIFLSFRFRCCQLQLRAKTDHFEKGSVCFTTRVFFSQEKCIDYTIYFFSVLLWLWAFFCTGNVRLSSIKSTVKNVCLIFFSLSLSGLISLFIMLISRSNSLWWVIQQHQPRWCFNSW